MMASREPTALPARRRDRDPARRRDLPVRALFMIPVLAAVLAVSVFGVRCTPAPRDPGGTTAPGTSTPGPAVQPRSSYSQRADGTVEAIGFVGRSDLEGGFWALYDNPIGPSSASQPRILAVLLAGDVTESAIAALDGAHVTLTGRPQPGASVRMAGPEVRVDTIAGLRNDTPQ